MTIRGLRELDLHGVPLPNGTEVVTTVSRTLSETGRHVPQAAIGRVVRSDGDRVVVRIVGVGDLDYERREVVPRKRGQVEFAVQRSSDEVALRPCTILRATVGSRAWGLAHEGSDEDLRGVFLLPFPWTTGLAAGPEAIVSADGSDTSWELGRAVGQALRADPNTLEMLFVPRVEVLAPIGQELLDARDAFVSSRIYGSFGRYALAQAKKLEQSLRLAEHRSLVLQWLRADAALSLDAVAARLAAEALGPADPESRHRAKQYVKQLYRSMHDQGLLEAASFEALVAFAQLRSAELELPRELRPKNAYNLLRIVSCAVQWLETGAPLIEVSGALRDRLLAIKAGEVPLRDALRWTEETAARLDEARSRTSLPPRPDVARADALLRRARAWAARQWLEAAPGPWGADAPDAPQAAAPGADADD